MKRSFVYDTDVEAAVRRNRVSDRQLRAMEQTIMEGGGDTIPGTGGFKKIRLVAHGRGKRGGLRIVFADYQYVGTTYLVAALAKGDRDNFTRRELNELRQLKRMLDKAARS